MSFLPFSHILRLRRELDSTDAEISTWGCDKYEGYIKQWSDSCDTYVGAVVRVTSANEAAIVVRFATTYSIPFTVKGGGYSTSGSSITRGGIVVDLSNLRRVHVDPVSRTVTAQGGALWEDIDVAAAQYNLAVVGSTLNQIGVAGSTMGGGFGWLTGQYGLALDNLLWVRMILSDGRVVTVSENTFPDLFWAIRGAGQSFGVAIELGLRAHKQDHPVFAGTLLFSAVCLPGIVRFANQFENLTDGKQALWLGFTMLPPLSQSSILVVIFHNGTQVDAEQFFAPLFSLGPMKNTTQVLPYDSLNGILSLMDTPVCSGTVTKCDIAHPNIAKTGPRKSLRGSNITLPLNIEFVQSIYNEFDRLLQDCPQARDSRFFIELLPNAQVRKVSNDATAFASRGPYYNVSSLFRWIDGDLDERIHSFQKHLMTKVGIEAGVTRLPNYNVKSHGTGLYANYAGHDLPLEALFGSNISRLRELKKKYDPQNTFRKWHNISPPIDPGVAPE